jgi:hypothetical protein
VAAAANSPQASSQVASAGKGQGQDKGRRERSRRAIGSEALIVAVSTAGGCGECRICGACVRLIGRSSAAHRPLIGG